MSMGKAGKQFNIPKQTLFDRMSGKIKSRHARQKTDLTMDDVYGLINYIK